MRRALVLSIATAMGGCGAGDHVSADAGALNVDAGVADSDRGHDAWTGQEASIDAEAGRPSGTIDPRGGGGTVNRLAFTAFGDIRPALPDEDFAYPNATVKSIVGEMATLGPEFAVATGDYMFVEYIPSSATGQLQALLDDEKTFTSPIFHAMGNHECQSFTDVNCPNLDESVNITTYLSMLLPWTKVPWFSFIVHTDMGDAKFVFVAVNAWNDTQAQWLTQTMALQTRYTFIIRHHPTPDAGHPSSAEGIAGSDTILNNYPVTLLLFGHVHEYARLTPNRVITGNAGAPLDEGMYGYLYVEQRPDGNIQATEHELGGAAPIDTFAVTPDGHATQ